jgi:hypothetical protein
LKLEEASMQNGRGAVVAVGLAVLCCALPLLFIAGASIGAGLIFGEIALVAAGIGGIGYAVYKVTRRRRRL